MPWFSTVVYANFDKLHTHSHSYFPISQWFIFMYAKITANGWVIYKIAHMRQFFQKKKFLIKGKYLFATTLPTLSKLFCRRFFILFFVCVNKIIKWFSFDRGIEVYIAKFWINGHFQEIQDIESQSQRCVATKWKKNSSNVLIFLEVAFRPFSADTEIDVSLPGVKKKKKYRNERGIWFGVDACVYCTQLHINENGKVYND